MFSHEYIAMEMHRIRENEMKQNLRRSRSHIEILEEIKREALRNKKNRK